MYAIKNHIYTHLLKFRTIEISYKHVIKNRRLKKKYFGFK